ncbi:hypothetical protein IF803_08905 [Bradyrhizobium sp. UFLA06-06]
MSASPTINADQLKFTPRGKAWLNQFDVADVQHAEKALAALTLVSHTEFERSLSALIDRIASSFRSPVALFATREVDPAAPLFVNRTTRPAAVDAANDLGSEARVAAIIRNLARAEPNKFLNHPSIEEMRLAKCPALICVDDFIGSGHRTSEYVNAIWKNKTIRSWTSFGWLRFHAVAYSATEGGRSLVESTKAKVQVTIERECPTFNALPWQSSLRKTIDRVFYKYAARTTYPFDPRGYDNTGATLVFEHGCPDNCPVIFWASSAATSIWEPLFPKRSVLPPEASAFPAGIPQRDPTATMIDVGQKKLAGSGALSRRGPIGIAVLTVMALAARGVRTRSALSHATSISARDCTRILELCVDWKFLTPKLRPTKAGLAELSYAKSLLPTYEKIPMIGENEYYPKQLRRPVHG